MRIKIKFSKITDELIQNNQALVNHYIHKCLGENNEYHDSHSNYCVSRLCGGSFVENGKYVEFKNSAFIVATSVDTEFIDRLISGVMKNENFGGGLMFSDIEFIQEKIYDGYNHFKTMDNGFIIKSIPEKGKYKFHTINDDDFIDVLTNHIIKKFSKVDPTLDFTNFSIDIPQHKNHKTRNIYVKNVKNISNICQLMINSNRRVAEALYNYGIGQSTGSGFGTIYKTENHKLYV